VNLTRVAREANEIADLSRYGSAAPRLTPESTRETLIAWLMWCDPNGSHTDALAAGDDVPAHTVTTAWEAIAEMIDGA
jgi:hypothetical protein